MPPLLNAIVESSDDAVVSKDVNGVITSWNKGAERLFGYTAEEPGRSSYVYSTRSPGRGKKILEQLKRGERMDHFKTPGAKDGSQVNIALTISPVKDADGRVVGASKSRATLPVASSPRKRCANTPSS